MRARKPAHLTRRGNAFYFRVAIPTDLRQFFSGAELKVSLRTDDPAAARLKHQRLTYLWEGITHSLARMTELQRFPLKKVGVLVREYFVRQVEQKSFAAEYGPREDGFDVSAEITHANLRLDHLRQAIGARKFDNIVVGEAQTLIAESGYGPPMKHSDVLDNLCHGLLRAEAEAVRIFVAMLQGRYDETPPRDPIFIEHAPIIAPMSSGAALKSQTVEILSDRYVELKGMAWAKKTVLDNKRVLRWFRELVGADTLASEITPDAVRKYRDVLLELPSNYAKSKIFEGLSLPTIVKTGKEAGSNKLSPRTADKYLGMLKSFLDWIRKEGYVTTNPAGEISVPFKKEKALDARHPFTLEQLRIIFKSTVYTGHKSADRRFEAGTAITKDGKYWVPLIALFTGMRLGEIVQLQNKDVRQQDGVWVFDVNKDEEAGKSLKTVTSKRLIPVHPTLISLGFLSYVQETSDTASPSERIFSDIAIGADGYASHNFSKYFSRFLKAVGAKKAKTSFHSFRHGFKDAMHLAGIQDSRQNALLGHSNNTAAESYGSGIPVKALYEDICHISFPGLDLDHLHKSC